MRLAAISDVHSNLNALEAVLADIKKRKVRRKVFVGDAVGYGPDPDEVTALIEKECRTGAVAGNHDWGVLGLTLYKLIKSGDERSSAAAKKSFILIGASDSIMIFGVGLLWVLSGSLRISDIQTPTNTGRSYTGTYARMNSSTHLFWFGIKI